MCSLPLALENVLARYVRSIAFYHPIRNASMQRDFTSDGRNSKANSSRTLVIFSCIFTVRRYALHGICYSNSVCLSVCLSVRPSVCHTRGLCPQGSTYDHDFFTIW